MEIINSDINKIVNAFKTQIETSEDKRSTFIKVFSATAEDERFALTIQLINDELYALYFINNQFYDISPSKLRIILEKILNGNYLVEQDHDRYITVLDGNDKITPERITSDKGFEDIYTHMPFKFATPQ